MLLLDGLDPGTLTVSHAVVWWGHMLANTALLVYMPASKLAHIFTGPTNVFMRATDARAALPLVANEQALKKHDCVSFDGLASIRDHLAQPQ